MGPVTSCANGRNATNRLRSSGSRRKNDRRERSVASLKPSCAAADERVSTEPSLFGATDNAYRAPVTVRDRSIAALVDLSRDVADADDPDSIPHLLAGAAVRRLEARVVAVFLVSSRGTHDLVHVTGCTAEELVESGEGLEHTVPA